MAKPLFHTDGDTDVIEVRFHAPSFVVGIMAGVLITIGTVFIAAFISAAMAGAR